MLEFQEQNSSGFPGDSMVKKPSASAGDRGSIPDPEGSHMTHGN